MAITERRADPITTEIIRSAFTAAADEMNATLIRSAYTPIIYEMKDCSVALLDADHRVLGQSAGLPIFLGNLEICTRLTEEMYGRDSLARGRRLDHERLLPDGDASERHDGLRADLPRRRPGWLRRLSRALARRGRQGRRRADELDRDLPGGHPPRTDEGRGGRCPARRRDGFARPQQPLLVSGDRRPGRADRLCPHGAGAPPGDHRPVRSGDDRGRAGRDLCPDRAPRARGGRGDPGRRLPGGGLPGRQRRVT